MKRVLALGFFDGVHLGHGKLLRRAACHAEAFGVPACALTFDRHPLSVVKGRPVPLLCGEAERERLIKTLYGLSEVEMLPFDGGFMRMPWQSFIQEILIERMAARHVIAGYDFTFGYKGEGTPKMLSAVLESRGIGCEIIPPERIRGIRVSSTYIRGLVAEGDMEQAAEFLGHPYCFSGIVQEGNGLGRQFGYPTLNIPLPPERQWPAWGVYLTAVRWNGKEYPALTNVGLRPTVERGGVPTVESTLPDFSGNLYGQPIDVLFGRFLRPERKFPSIDALRAQIARDIEAVQS